jgi:hypothetical protein
MTRVFLLSPAHAGGKRAELLLREEARFPLAERLRGVRGIALGEAFSFMSGLYFRGKLAYTQRFASPPALGAVDIRADDPRYRAPLAADLASGCSFPPPSWAAVT